MKTLTASLLQGRQKLPILSRESHVRLMDNLTSRNYLDSGSISQARGFKKILTATMKINDEDC